MTGEPWDEPIDSWDPAATDFFGAPRSKDGGARARSRSGNTGEFRILDDPAGAADSGPGRHRDREPRRRELEPRRREPEARQHTPSSVASSAVAGVAGVVVARTTAQPGPDRSGGFAPAASSFDAAEFRNSATAETQTVAGAPRPAPAAGGRFAGLRRLLRRRWFAPGLTGGVVLCSVALVTGVAQFAGTACAAVLPAGVETSGQATFYDGGAGNCSYPSLPADDLYVALGPEEYSDAGACGGYLDVTGPSGSVRVKIVDQCPECEEGHIDLSREAFEQIADPEAGVVPVTYSAVANPAVGKLSVRVKEGSSAFWLAILLDNHGNPLTNVEVSGPSGGFTALDRTSFNYWVADGGLGAGPFSVRVTDNAGRTATIQNITLSPGSVQPSTVALGGRSAVTAPTTKAATPSAGSAVDAPLAAADGGSSSSGSSDSESSSRESSDSESSSTTRQSETKTETAVTPDADASEEIAANPAPSSSIAVPRAGESTAGSTGRNSCG